jgi:1,4-alpha-glucan branching enzyme
MTPADLHALSCLRHREPRAVLGHHAVRAGAGTVHVVRVFEPDAAMVAVAWAGSRTYTPLAALEAPGYYGGEVPPPGDAHWYLVRVTRADGSTWERADAYAFPPDISADDLFLYGEGNHLRLWEMLGAQPQRRHGIDGTRFAVWAPNAQRISVVGPFNHWDGRRHPMQWRGPGGVWELFIPDVGPGTLYKFEVLGADGSLVLKTDPLARAMELRPGNCGIVTAAGHQASHGWRDAGWMSRRAAGDIAREVMSVYEVHPGTWRRQGNDRGGDPGYLDWDQLAAQLIPYMTEQGFTHVELMGVAEHPFDGSWGYQVTGYYAPTSRHGTPDAFRRFVDRCHQAGLGVLLDWVPAHFPKDANALARFDGTALYEHADPRKGEHRAWGTQVFNYARHEVRNFLVANALYWAEEFHVDGIRVDAVAAMLHLDYDRPDGEWVANEHGGRENLEAVSLLQVVNARLQERHPGFITCAEESTTFPGVTRPVAHGGLGFTFKWNMGWMNDTLRYVSTDPLFRRYAHSLITFSFMYAWSERFLLPLSHDEVVHGKRSLLEKMPGDDWQQRAGLRLLLAYQWATPGKKLLFMGGEFGQRHEWRDHEALDWGLLGDERHVGLLACVRTLNGLLRTRPALYAADQEPAGFRWVDVDSGELSVFAFERHAPGAAPLLCAFNATPVPRPDYWLGVDGGRWRCVFDSDAGWMGGSDWRPDGELSAQHPGCHGRPQALHANLPPLGARFYERIG